jgi:hypothetical protein
MDARARRQVRLFGRRGLSAESILADDAVDAKILQAVLGLATRSKLSLGTGGLRS